MLIRKCDICKKRINNGQKIVQAARGYDSFEFCEKCGEPVLRLLRNHALII